MVTIVERKNRKQTIKDCLDNIKSKSQDGLIKPDAVLEEASDESHPLHQEFEWDDSLAGHHYRLQQARQIIREFTVEIVEDNKPSRKMRGYVSLLRDRVKGGGGGYRETKDVMKEENLMQELESTFKAELDALLNRYEVLKSLCAEVRKAAKIEARRGQRKAV